MNSQVDELAKLVKLVRVFIMLTQLMVITVVNLVNIVEGTKVTFPVPANKEGMTPINCGSMVLSDSGSASMILRMAAEGIIGNTISVIDVACLVRHRSVGHYRAHFIFGLINS